MHLRRNGSEKPLPRKNRNMEEQQPSPIVFVLIAAQNADTIIVYSVI